MTDIDQPYSELVNAVRKATRSRHPRWDVCGGWLWAVGEPASAAPDTRGRDRVGIALDAGHTVDRDQAAAALQPAERRPVQAKVYATSGALMEQLFPGWTDSGQELDERVRQSTQNAIHEAELDRAEALAAPQRSELVEHWTRLGGPTTRLTARSRPSTP